MESASESVAINILSWNIRGLKAKLGDHRKNRLLKIFGEHDVVLLQETHIGEMKADYDADWNYITDVIQDEYAFKKLNDQRYAEREDTQQKTMYMTYFSSSSKGVAILINKPHILLSAYCEGGDYAWVHVEIDEQRYTFVSVYYSGSEPDLICDLMLKIFCSFLTDGSDAFKSRLVIGGDFNTTLNPRLDANKHISGHAPRNKKLKRFMTILKLSDVWRKKHGQKREYTRTHPRGNVKSRLDYIFMLESDVHCVVRCDICKNIGTNLSDHFPVLLTLRMNRTNGIFDSEE